MFARKPLHWVGMLVMVVGVICLSVSKKTRRCAATPGCVTVATLLSIIGCLTACLAFDGPLYDEVKVRYTKPWCGGARESGSRHNITLRTRSRLAVGHAQIFEKMCLNSFLLTCCARQRTYYPVHTATGYLITPSVPYSCAILLFQSQAGSFFSSFKKSARAGN